MAFDVQGALNAGYSAQEIADYLGKKNHYDVDTARKQGLDDASILDGYLASLTPKKEQAVGNIEQSALSKPAEKIDLGDAYENLGIDSEEVADISGPANYAAETMRNVPGSAMELARGLGHVITHPGEAVDNLGNVVLGYKEKGARLLNPEEAPGEHEKYADAVNGMVAERYGTPERAAKTFQKDPLGVGMDASMLLGGGGAALRGAGAVSKVAGAANAGANIAKAGEVLTKAGQIADPLTTLSYLAKPFSPLVDAVKGQVSKYISPEAIYARAMKIPPRSISKAERDKIIEAGIRERIPINESGIKKADELRKELGKSISDELSKPENAAKRIDPVDTAIMAEADVVPYFRTQVTPTQSMEAAGKVFDDFLDNYPRPLSLEEAQKLKVGTYDQLNKKAWEERQKPTAETEKALARALRIQIEDAAPAVKAINQRLAGLKALADELPNAINRTGNHGMFNLVGPQGAMAALGASIAGTPGMVAGWGLGKAASSPRFQSELAFAMDAARKGYRASAPVRRWMKKSGIPAKYGAYFEARYGGLIGEMERSR